MVNGFDYDKVHYANFYTPIVNSGIRPDVITTAKNLSNYKLLFSPLLPTLEEGDLVSRITTWVENGGVWVVGPMTDIRTSIGSKYTHSPYGHLEEMLEERLVYILPDDAGRLTLENETGEAVRGTGVYELFEKGEFAPWLTVKDGHSALVGKCASFVKKIGDGYVVMVGTLPEEGELIRIIQKSATLAGAHVYDVDDGIMVTKRVGENETLYIAAAVKGQAGEFRFDGECVDILTGKSYAGKVSLGPYELCVLKKI
jgi:beta-galactosidase GanA